MESACVWGLTRNTGTNDDDGGTRRGIHERNGTGTFMNVCFACERDREKCGFSLAREAEIAGVRYI